MPDSAGMTAGKPSFAEGSKTIDSDTMRYNFDTQKALIKQIITRRVKAICTVKRPSALLTEKYISARVNTPPVMRASPLLYPADQSIAIPEEKIVSGPAYMVLADVPLPLALPFGFFPNTESRASGLIIPLTAKKKQEVSSEKRRLVFCI